MDVEWDPAKALENARKHGVRFPDAEAVLFDPMGVTVEDCRAQGDQRLAVLGMDALGRLRVVIYTHRGNRVRIISARRATRSERRSYEEGV